MKHSDQSAGISSFYSRAEAVVGETFDLSAKAQGTVTYTSSNPNVATVTNDGDFTHNFLQLANLETVYNKVNHHLVLA